MPFLYQPPAPHQCKLPWRSLSLGFPPGVPGARWQCDDCGKKWIYLTYSGVRDWEPLRWWHRWTHPMRATDEEAGSALPLHCTEAGWPRCSTCDGGGCPDCTDPA